MDINKIINDLTNKKITMVDLKSILKNLVDIHDDERPKDKSGNRQFMLKDKLLQTKEKLIEYLSNLKNNNYHEYNFGEKLIKLNDEQYNIVVANKTRNMRIIACAGSGKTTTILCRIKYLIDNGTYPNKILLLTFNKAARENLQKIISKLFGFMPSVRICTIDSFAASMCMKYSRYIPRMQENVSVGEFAPIMAELMKSSYGKEIAGNYQYIFFDEFQDVSDHHFKIIKKLADNGCNGTIIGDDAQNIYTFRGTNVAYIMNFDKYIKEVDTYILTINYRSTPEIISIANASIKHNKDQIKKTMISTNPSIGKKPKVLVFQNYDHQDMHIINKLLEFKKNGIPYHEMVIISKGNEALKEFETNLAKHNRDHPKKYIKYIALITEDNSDIAPSLLVDHLCLVTIHKSKGLEWKKGFFIGCGDTSIPKKCDEISIQEERRLFYVAVTRPKDELYFTITAKKLPLTRFIKELPNDLYEVENHVGLEPFGHYDERINEIKYNVTGVIKSFRPCDLSYLREKNLIPKPKVRVVHNAYEHSFDVNKYYLHTDFGQFVDRYLSRKIMENDPLLRSYDDPSADEIIYSIYIDRGGLYGLYNDHMKRLLQEFDMKNKFSHIINDNEFLAYLQMEMGDLFSHQCRELAKKILQKSKEVKVLPHKISVVTYGYLPDEFEKEMLITYKMFRDPSLKTDDLLEVVYKVSLCGSIADKRRRLLYMNVYDSFMEGRVDMFRDMSEYCKTFKDKKFVSKRVVRHSNGGIFIDGELDLLNVSDRCIVDYKCSVAVSDDVSWVLQELAYKAMLEAEGAGGGFKGAIKNLEIYNPMSGKVYNYDVENWNGGKILLDLMYMVINRSLGN